MLPEQRFRPCGVALPDDLQPAARLQPVALDVHVGPRLHSPGRVRQEYDVRLEPLGLVQVHQAHDVSTPGLERERLHFVGRLAVGFQRISRIGQAAAGFDDLAYAVDGVQHIARVDTTGCRPRPRKVPARFENPFERAGRGEHAGPAVVVTQGVERGADAVGWAGHTTRPCAGLRLEHREPAAGLLEREQLGIADAEERTTEHGHERQRILRVGQRAQQRRQRLDLSRFAKRAGAAHFRRNVQRFERGGVGGDAVSLLPRQDQEIAEVSPPGIDLRTNVGGNPCRIHGRKLRRLVAVVREGAHLAAHGLLRCRVERRKPGRVRGRHVRKPRLEHGVGPRAQVAPRPEVHGERQDYAHTLRVEPPANEVVNVDVGATEPVDRLLRVAHDEEDPWAKRHLPPVCRIGLPRP